MKVSELYEFLPHRDEMIWIDEVLEFNDDGVMCQVLLNEQKLFLSNGAVRQSAYIEWCAQAFGYGNACRFKDSESRPEKAYLVGFEKVEFLEEITDEKKIQIRVKLKRQVGPISYLEGEIFSRETSKVFGNLTLKVFSE